MALAAGTGYLVNLIYYVSTSTLKMVGEIPVPSPTPVRKDTLTLKKLHMTSE